MTEAEKYRPNPCGIPRWEDPTRFICRCFTFAGEAAKSALKPLGTPTVALADLQCGKPGDEYGNGRTVSWLMGELCDQLAFELDDQLTFDALDERSRARRAADLIGAFCDFMQWRGVPYLDARHTGADGTTVAAALEATLRSVDAEAMTIAATPDEFRQRLTALLDLDAAAQPTTAHPADGDELVRKVTDAVADTVGGQLKPIADDIQATKVAVEAAAELIRGLSPEWLTGDEPPPRQYIKIAGSIKMRIFDLWEAYDHDPEDNGGRKADYATFYELNGGQEIHKGETLQSFIEGQAQKDKEMRTPEQLIERIIKSERERRRKAQEKQKTNLSQIRHN